jgi:hypothetical protein
VMQREIHRRVSVRSTSGEPARVVITVRRSWVFVFIDPHFVGDAVLDPEKVDEVIRALAQAREDAKRLGRGGNGAGGSRGGGGRTRPPTSGAGS